MFRLIPQALAVSDINISNLSYPGQKIQNGWDIGQLLTGGGSGFKVIDFVFFIAGLLFFFNLLYAGWDYLLSTGDPKKASSATSRLLNAFVGIVIVLGSFVIVRIATAIIGLPGLV